MLIIGLIVAAILGPLYVWRNTEYPTIKRYGIGSAIAVLGAAVTPLAMAQCSFAEHSTGVDKLLGYSLMFGGGWLALMGARVFWDRADGKEKKNDAFAGEIRTGGFRLGVWVPWVLLSPTLIILLVFLYFPAVSTFTLSTKLTRLGAPKSIDVCFTNFTELLITDPAKLVAYPLIAIALIFSFSLFKRVSASSYSFCRLSALARSFFICALVSCFALARAFLCAVFRSEAFCF